MATEVTVGLVGFTRRNLLFLLVLGIVALVDVGISAVAYAQTGQPTSPPLTIAAFIFVGIVARGLLPTIQRLREATPEKPFKWNHTYTATLVFTLAVSSIALPFVLQTIPAAGLGSVSAAFIVGWGSHDITNQLVAT